MEKERHLRFLITILCLLCFNSVLFGQLRITPTEFLLGENAQTTDGIRFVIEGKNGVHWKFKDHYLKVNLRGTSPALSGTNGWFHFASFHYSPTPDLVEIVCRDIYLLSDERAKTDITDISTSLGKINDLQLQRTVVDSSMTDGQENLKSNRANETVSEIASIENRNYRLSSETLERNFPMLVDTEENGDVYVDYIGLIPVLIESVKEAYEAVKTQEELIETLRQELSK